MSNQCVEVPNQKAMAHLPTRLHHHAYVTDDQEATRHFYEDILGIPLVALWIENEEFQGNTVVFSHAFYEIADGSALAFFNFADAAQQAMFAAKQQLLFVHVALHVSSEAAVLLRQRLEAADIKTQTLEHGYCRSLYVTDPNGLILEFTEDAQNVDQINSRQRASAHASLKRWLAGERKSNKAEAIK